MLMMISDQSKYDQWVRGELKFNDDEEEGQIARRPLGPPSDLTEVERDDKGLNVNDDGLPTSKPHSSEELQRLQSMIMELNTNKNKHT